MSPIIAKLILPLIAPLGLCAALWVLGLGLYWRGRGDWGRWCVGAGIAGVVISGNPLVGDALLGGLEDDFAIVSAAASPAAEAIVVLGGVTVPPVPPRVAVEVDGGIDRLLHGLRLFRAGKAPVLIFSGGALTRLTGSGMSEAEQFLQLAVESGIDPAAAVLEGRSRNTHENARNVQGILAERGLKRVLLVTSAYHMRRSVASFRAQGVEVIPAPTDVRVVNRGFSLLRLVPTATALEKSSIAIKEHVGWWYYRLRGWID